MGIERVFAYIFCQFIILKGLVLLYDIFRVSMVAVRKPHLSSTPEQFLIVFLAIIATAHIIWNVLTLLEGEDGTDGGGGGTLT